MTAPTRFVLLLLLLLAVVAWPVASQEGDSGIEDDDGLEEGMGTGGDLPTAAKARLIGIGVVAAVLLACLIAYLARLRLGQLSPRRRAATKQQMRAQQRPYQLSDNSNGAVALGLADESLAKDASATLDVQGARQHSLSYSAADEEAGRLPVAIGVSVAPVRAVGMARGYDAFA